MNIPAPTQVQIHWSAPLEFKNASWSEALAHIKHGGKVQRAGWNGKGMWLRLVNGHIINDEGLMLRRDPYIEMFTVQGTLVPWLASQTDQLAEDWQSV